MHYKSLKTSKCNIILLLFLTIAVACSRSAKNIDQNQENTFLHSIEITYNEQQTTVSADSIEGVSVSTDEQGNVTIQSSVEKVNYIVSGQTKQGSLCINSKKTFALTLKNVNMQSVGAPTLRIVGNGDLFLFLPEKSQNYLADDAQSPQANKATLKQWAALYCAGNMIVAGEGSLSLSSHCKQAIRVGGNMNIVGNPTINAISDQHHAMSVKGNLSIDGGTTTAHAIADGKNALKVGGYICIEQGKLTLIADGNAKQKSKHLGDYKTTAAMVADSSINIRSGIVDIRTTGDAAKGIKTKSALTISGGQLTISALGTSEHGSAKGIKAFGNITISGGNIDVLSATSEGIESKNNMTICGGQVSVEASDDAINASTHLLISGGNIWARSARNDGLDSNGNLCIEGGTITAIGGPMPESGIDANDEEGYAVYISGGTLKAVGGWNSLPLQNDPSQPVLTFDADLSVISVNTASGDTLLTFDATTTDAFRIKPDTLHPNGDMPPMMPPPPMLGAINGNMPPHFGMEISNRWNYVISAPKLKDGEIYNIDLGEGRRIKTKAQIEPERKMMPMPPF